MGCCYSSKNIISSCYGRTPDYTNSVQYKVALKLPHGQQYLDFNGTTFVKHLNIHEWIYCQFMGKTFTNYINYNDEQEHKICAVGGHCKGCIAWNDNEVCWLIHSVPKFAIHFDEDGHIVLKETIIRSSEQTYGQSFVFLSGLSISQLPEFLQQISIMKPFIDCASTNSSLPLLTLEVAASMLMSTISLSHESTVIHVAKSPRNHIDIFSEMIQPALGGKWRCETWIRGHHCPVDVNQNVVDNNNITFGPITYHSSQDHSKYACNDVDLVYIGDLNRMTTQYQRGGGGIIIQDVKLNKAIKELMDK
jgi:Deoxyribonuclease II